MADNIQITAGSGTTVATDELVDGSHVQLMKIVDATANGTNRLIVDSTGAAYTRVLGNPSVVQPTKITSNTLTAASQTLGWSDPDGVSTVGIQLSGTWAGTVVFEGTVNGSTWVTVNAVTPTGGIVTSTTSSGVWLVDFAGFASIRARVSVYTSGSIVAHMRGSPFQALVGIDAPIPTGSNNIGAVSITTTSPSYLTSTASTNGTVVKSSAATLHSISATNLSASVRYLKLYNSTSVTVGTTATAMTFILPATSSQTFTFGTPGFRFAVGLCMSVTGGSAETDTTAIGAGEVSILTNYA